jgi:N-acetylmuramoyl-L-alanine amidase
MPIHTVTQGDCINSIAAQWGLFWETIWNDPKNAELAALRQNPNALLPGDKVFVPDKRKKEEGCETTRRHVFRIRGVPVRLNLQILDTGQKPRAGLRYTLVIDGRQVDGVIPEDGRISEIIAPNAKKAKLTLRPADGPVEEYDMNIGHMNPVTDLTGVQGRLKNLGYYRGQMHGSLDEETAEALREFQASRGLEVTGAPDEATQGALSGLHGG